MRRKVVLQTPYNSFHQEEQSNIDSPSGPLSKTQSHHGEAKGISYYASPLAATVLRAPDELDRDFIQLIDLNVIGHWSHMPLLQTERFERLP